MLRSQRYEKVEELVPALLAEPSNADPQRIESLLLEHLEALRSAGNAEQLESYVEALDCLPPDAFTPQFRQALDAAPPTRSRKRTKPDKQPPSYPSAARASASEPHRSAL